MSSNVAEIELRKKGLLALFLKNLVYLLCFGLSLRVIYVAFSSSHGINLPIKIAVFILLAYIAWRNVKFTLVLFFAFVPLINGLQVLRLIGSTSLLSFMFAVIYSARYSKSLFFDSPDVSAKSTTGNLAELLAGLILISLFFSLSHYPLDFIFYRIGTLPYNGQNGPLWSIEASITIIQGILFYRLIENEFAQKRQDFVYFRYALYFQAIVIIILSLFQIFFNQPAKFEDAGIFLPLSDIHSYGSYIVFCFFFFLIAASAHGRILHFTSIFSLFFFIFIFLSASFATLAAFLIVGFFFLITKLNKIYLTIAITALAGFIIFINYNPSVLDSFNNPVVKRYSQRAVFKKAVEKAAGRIESSDQALGLIKAFPLTGSGIGSFYKNSRHYHISDTAYPFRIENAHNYYLQFAAELGLPILIIFLSIITISLKIGFQNIKNHKPSREVSIGLIFGFCAYLMTMLTGHPLLLLEQQFFFWFMIAAIIILNNDPEVNRFSKVTVSKKILLFGFLPLVSVFAFLFMNFSGNFKIPDKEYGYYPYENWERQKMRWTWRKASSQVTAGSNLFGFKMVAHPFNSSSPQGLKVGLKLNGEFIDEIHFIDGGVKPRYYYFPDLINQDVEISMVINKTFTPSQFGSKSDKRELGIGVSPLTFLKIFPPDGVGFYDWEVLTGSDKPKIFLNRDPFHFRQTAKRASMALTAQHQKGLSLYLKTKYPEVQQHPVKVTLLGDLGIIKKETIIDNRWHKIVLEPAQIQNTKMLTIEVEKTWNPKILGIADDDRDLGLAVAFYEKEN